MRFTFQGGIDEGVPLSSSAHRMEYTTTLMMEDFQSTTVHYTCPWSSQVSAMARFEVDHASIRLADDLFEKPDDLLRPHCDLMQRESARDANQIGRLSTKSWSQWTKSRWYAAVCEHHLTTSKWQLLGKWEDEMGWCCELRGRVFFHVSNCGIWNKSHRFQWRRGNSNAFPGFLSVLGSS